MKRATQEPRRAVKRNSNSKTTGKSGRSNVLVGGETAQAARQIANRAQELYYKAHELDRKADAVHMAADTVHRHAAVLHGEDPLADWGLEPGPAQRGEHAARRGQANTGRRHRRSGR